MDGEFYCKGFFEPAAPPRTPSAVSPGQGWERPGDLIWGDETLAAAYRRSRGAFCRRGGEGGFALAYPLDCRRPFPLPALFCFAQVKCMASRGWWVFSFTAEGLPRFPDA